MRDTTTSIPLKIAPVKERFWIKNEIGTNKSRKLEETKKELCFIHGLGERYETTDYPKTIVGTAKVITQDKPYWEYLEDYIPKTGAGYNPHIYLAKTQLYGWSDNQLLIETLKWIINKKCDQIYAHSMGNVVLLAINNRMGELFDTLTQDEKTSLELLTKVLPNRQTYNGKNLLIRWGSLAPPFHGSYASQVIYSICSGSVLNPIYGIAVLLGYCDHTNRVPYPSVTSLIPRNANKWFGPCTSLKTYCSSKELGSFHDGSWVYCNPKSLFDFSGKANCYDRGEIMYPCTIPVDKNIYLLPFKQMKKTGGKLSYDNGCTFQSSVSPKDVVVSQVCGYDPLGVNSIKWGGSLFVVSSYINFGDSEKDDGFVAFASCASSRVNEFSNNHKDKFYRSAINHANAAFYTPEGTSDSTKYGSWLYNRIETYDYENDAVFVTKNK